jgi:hypothetical protein
MQHRFLACARPVVLLAAAVCIALPAAAQRHNPAPENSPAAVPRGEAPAPAPPPTSDGDTERTSSPTGDAGTVRRPRDSGRTGADNPGSRPRNGQPIVGEAVPRTDPPPARGGDTTVVVPGGYGGYGYGGYYGGYYDPYDPERSYPDPAEIYAPRLYEEGKLRLKVSPKKASVFIDGYYTGIVDDMDGMFQKLRIEAGPHRIEVQEPGFETLTFNVRIEPGRTTTYRGGLKKLP